MWKCFKNQIILIILFIVFVCFLNRAQKLLVDEVRIHSQGLCYWTGSFCRYSESWCFFSYDLKCNYNHLLSHHQTIRFLNLPCSTQIFIWSSSNLPLANDLRLYRRTLLSLLFFLPSEKSATPMRQVWTTSCSSLKLSQWCFHGHHQQTVKVKNSDY